MKASEVRWCDSRGNIFSLEEVKNTIKKRLMIDGEKVRIGSDSHRARKGKYVACATAICSWNEENPRGGWYVYARSLVPKKRFSSLYERLFFEVEESVQAAVSLQMLGIEIESIHINVNPTESEDSSVYASSLRGYVEAFGFKCVLKPNDWAAGGVADKHAR